MHTTASVASRDFVSDLLKTIYIPPCPTIAAELMRESRRDDIDLPRIVKLVSSDVSLAASVMKMANSPAFLARQRMDSIQKAVAMLGMRNIQAIVTGIGLKQSLNAGNVDMDAFWKRTACHALVAARLARRLPGVPVEDAYLFGLFHDCGIPILMQRFSDYSEMMAQASHMVRPVWQLEQEKYSTDHALVGAMLARNWQLPPVITNAIAVHHDFERLERHAEESAGESLGLTVISLVADHLIARVAGSPDDVEWMAHGAAAMDYLGFDEAEMEEISRDLHDDVLAILTDQH